MKNMRASTGFDSAMSVFIPVLGAVAVVVVICFTAFVLRKKYNKFMKEMKHVPEELVSTYCLSLSSLIIYGTVSFLDFLSYTRSTAIAKSSTVRFGIPKNNAFGKFTACWNPKIRKIITKFLFQNTTAQL